MTIAEKNSKIFIPTNAEGKFLTKFSPKAQSLDFILVGMETRNVSIGKRTDLNIRLKAASSINGSIASGSSKDIALFFIGFPDWISSARLSASTGT